MHLYQHILDASNQFPSDKPVFVVYDPILDKIRSKNPRRTLTYEDGIPFAYETSVYLLQNDYVFVTSNLHFLSWFSSSLRAVVGTIG